MTPYGYEAMDGRETAKKTNPDEDAEITHEM